MSSTNGNGSAQIHNDGLTNVLTGLGVAGYDPSLATRIGFSRRTLQRDEQAEYVRRYGLCRKCVMNLPQAATTKWGKIIAEQGDPKDLQAFEKWLNNIKVNPLFAQPVKGIKTAFRLAAIAAFQTGNGALVLDIDDGNGIDEPVDRKAIKTIKQVWVLDRWSCYPDMTGLSLNGGFEHYYLATITPRLAPNMGSSPRVHRDRVLWFRGIELSDWSLWNNQGCDDSILESLVDAFNIYLPAISGAGRMLTDYDIVDHLIEGLHDGLQHGGSQYETFVKERLRLNQMSVSAYRGRVLDKDKEMIQHSTRNAGGYSDLLQQVKAYLQGSAPYPPSILFGEFSSGLDASGIATSERQVWNETTLTFQTEKFDPNISTLLEYGQLSKEGPLKGLTVEGIGMQWQSIYPTTPLEQSELEQNRAAIIQTIGAMDPRFVPAAILAHYRSAEYNPNIVLPEEYVKQLEEEIKNPPQPPEEESFDPEEFEGEIASDDAEPEPEVDLPPGLEEQTDSVDADIGIDSEKDLGTTNATVDLKPPLAVQRACKRGVKLHQNGYSGKGLEYATVREAMSLSRGEATTPEKVEKAVKWFARNQRFAAEPQTTPAGTSWYLWGGKPGQKWFNKLKRELDLTSTRTDADNTKSKPCPGGYRIPLTRKCRSKSDLKKTIAHTGEHLAENVTSWATGKVVGGAIAQIGTAHGLDDHTSKLFAETAVQALTATVLHARLAKNRKPKALAVKFVSEASAAFAGKLAHSGIEELFAGADHHVQLLAATVAGKGTGISTNATVSRALQRGGSAIARLINRQSDPPKLDGVRSDANPGDTVQLSDSDNEALFDLLVIAAMKLPTRTDATRPSCIQCVEKHLGSALVLMEEVDRGYPEHRLLAIGHLAQAEEESHEDMPDVAEAIRQSRIQYQETGEVPDFRYFYDLLFGDPSESEDIEPSYEQRFAMPVTVPVLVADSEDKPSKADRRKAKIKKVFDEWDAKELNIGKSKKKVSKSKKGHKQAIAISLSEAERVDANPNQAKRYLNLNGVTVGITNETGEQRFPNAQPLPCAYGFVRGTWGMGLDGKAIDCYVYDDGTRYNTLFKIAQITPEAGELDEWKYMIGFPDPGSAKSVHQMAVGKQRFGFITPAVWDELKPKQDAVEEDEPGEA